MARKLQLNHKDPLVEKSISQMLDTFDKFQGNRSPAMKGALTRSINRMRDTMIDFVYREQQIDMDHQLDIEHWIEEKS